MATKWVDISTIDNTTPFSAVRWKGALNINYDTGTTVAAFSEVPGLTLDENFNWMDGSGSTVGHYSLHRFGGTSEIYVAQFGGTDGQLDPTESSSYRVGVKNQAFSASGFYDTTVQIDGETFYEIDWTLWDSYTPLYFPYSGTPIQAGSLYVRIPDVKISLDTESTTMDSSGGSTTVTVQAQDDWSASTYDNWITISPASGNSGTSAVTISASDYTSTTANRSGSVVFECSGDSVTFTVTQNRVPGVGHPLYIGTTAIPDIKLGTTAISQVYLGQTLVFSSGPFQGLKLYPTSERVEYTGGSFTLSVKASEDWTLSVDSNYITASTYTGATGESSVTIDVAPNATTADVRTTITATTQNYSATCDVTMLHEIADYSSLYLTFDILGQGDIRWSCNNNSFGAKTISYSKDNGTTWTSVASTVDGTLIPVNAGDKVMFKGVNDTYGSGSYYSAFEGTEVSFIVYGNILSMIYGDDFRSYTTIPNYTYTFRNFFSSCQYLVSMEHLILPTNVTNTCYGWFAQACTSLVKAPVLPATTLKNECYKRSFRGTAITSIVLPATLLVLNCYEAMLATCTSLTHIECLATNPSTLYTSGWLADASETGTFVRANGVSWTRSTDGIPNGWTIVDKT